MFSQTNTNRVSFDIQKNKISYIQWSIQTLNVCKRRLNIINITLNITLPKAWKWGWFWHKHARSRYESICLASPNSLLHSHGAIAVALHNFLCVRARLGFVSWCTISTYTWLASAGDGKITAERFVFHYIIRAKLFPNYPIISTSGTYDFVQGIGLGLYGPSRIVIPLTFFFPVAC